MYHKTYWTRERIGQRLALLEPLVYRRAVALRPWRLFEHGGPQEQPLTGIAVRDDGWEEVPFNSYWGAWKRNYTLRTRFQAPMEWAGGDPPALFLPLGVRGDFSHPEALVYIDGTPVSGCDRHHPEVRLDAALVDGRPHLLALHAWTGNGGWPDAIPGDQPFMRPCTLVQIDSGLRAFIALARVTLGVAANTSESNPSHGRLLNALADAFRLLNLQEPVGDAFYNSVPAAHAALRAGCETAGPPLDVTLYAAGHAHIDVAWLWTLHQTRRKAGRTFRTVLHLMEQYPDYYFTQSQPQLYDYVRQDYPALFERIRDRVAGGRWEPVGGMWVEADCNLSGAEALARQFLLGRTFFRRHFGAGSESPILWLPDVFGYAWALPQLIKQAGLDYFFTIKIGWNQYNRMPYDSFWWQGIDGTRVLTHYSTTPTEGDNYASTYNAAADPAAMIGTWTNLQQKELHQSLLMAYGYGDGGGGPTREMLENLALTTSFPAAPRARQGRAIDFFRALEAESGARLPTWNGELYLEYHRGTYTTQARNKRANRKSEFALHDAEFLAAAALALTGGSDNGYAYPREALGRAWELVCLNQFHDIIPGSSIAEVYEDSTADYAEVAELAAAARNEALAAIAGRLGGDLLLANPTSFTQDSLVVWPERLEDGQSVLREGRPLPAQVVQAGTLLAAGPLPPYCITPLQLGAASSPPAPATSRVTADGERLENDFLRVTFDAGGEIISLYDKAAQRELLPPGAIDNQFQAFEDRPLNWDAWDIDIFYEEKMEAAEPAHSVRVVENGPLRAALVLERRLHNSSIRQTISLAHNRAQLDFETTIDWQERHTLLKVAFPLDLLATRATYEIQWGHVERPVHRNTSWDWARFESCAHKWVDLSEGDYGVSLLNDCKYGHDVHENVLRLSLLRGSTYPDPDADLGRHTFVYSLRPHTGSLHEDTVAAAYGLNDPPILFDARYLEKAGSTARDKPFSLIRSSRLHVIIETIKQAEDGRGLIVRLYESQRRRGDITLTCAFDLMEVWRTNLLEDDQERLAADGREITFAMRPFEIVTLRLIPGP